MKTLYALIVIFIALMAKPDIKVTVHIYTDAQGRVAQVELLQSTGSEAGDEKVRAAAIENFHKMVPVPTINARYVQPAIYRP